MKPSRAFIIVMALALAGCAASSAGGDGPETRDRLTRITAEEIEDATQSNAYQLVQELRPGWRGTAYLDGYRLGPLRELASVPVASVRSVEYLRPMEAASRFGIEHPDGGAILVMTR